MLELIEFISTIAPGVTSVIGIILSLVVFINKCKTTLDNFKADKDLLISQLRASDSEYKVQIQQLINQNKELAEVNAKLVDKLAKIKGYATKKE